VKFCERAGRVYTIKRKSWVGLRKEEGGELEELKGQPKPKAFCRNNVTEKKTKGNKRKGGASL